MTQSKLEESDSGNASSTVASSKNNNDVTASNIDDETANNEASLAQTTEKKVDTNNGAVVKEEGNSTTETAGEQQRPNSEGDEPKKGSLNSDQTEDCNTAKIDKDITTTSSTTEPSKSNIESNNNDLMTAKQSNNSTKKDESTNSSTKSSKQSNSKVPIDQDFDSDQYSDKNDTLLTMSFNQDGGCLAIGTASGFRICNVHPFQETFRRNLGFQMPTASSNGGGGSGGIARIEMLYRTNLLALTGHHSTASHSQYPPNKVLIYDDHSQRTIGELSFRQKILVTKLRRDRIVVVLRDRVYVYNFSDLSLLDKVHTGDNPAGLIGLSLDNCGVGGGGGAAGGEKAHNILGGNTNSNLGARNGMVLACPSTQRGQVRVELYGLRRTTFVDAHESALGALALSVDGSLLATASERGTVIRLYDTRGVTVGGGRAAASMNNTSGPTASVSSSVPLKEFRRGVERATISCLTFSLDSCWLGCASDHGTVHIFQAQDLNSTNNESSTQNNSNKTKPRSSSMTGKAMRMLPKLVSSPKKFLMDGEHSHAQVRGVPHPRAIVFVPDRERTIAVAGTDDYDNGVLLLAEFGNKESLAAATSNIRGGASGGIEDTEAKRIGYHRFFKKGGAATMHGRNNRRNTRSSSKDGKFNDDIVEGGAYIDDTSVNLRMNHIRIGDENEDDFVPIDYDMEKK